jgi:rod shape determining protein RodA
MANPVAEVAGVRRDVRSRTPEHGLLVTLIGHIDWLLFGGVAALIGFGLWALGGITRYDDPTNPRYFVNHQAVFVVLGTVLAIGVVVLGPARLLRLWRPLYAGTVGALALVLVAGQNVRGATRWVSVGSFQVQPSELAKPLLAIALAGFLAESGRRIVETRTLLIAIALAIVPTLLVFVEPDLGTAMVYAALLAGALFISGVPWTKLVATALGALLLAVAVIWFVPALTGHHILKPYQERRLIGFYKSSHDAASATYNVTQSKIALASGGVRGRGEVYATQTRYNFLPAHRNDFAFAAFAEQHGFIGAAALLLLYLLILWRGVRVITLATTSFSAIAAGSVVAMLAFQVAINVGMTMQIAPVTGIPLPLVSYGGSATVGTLVALGVLLAIQIRSGRKRTV